MVTMAQSAANWGNTHTHVDRTHSLTHLNINTVTTTVYEAPAQLLQISNLFLFGRYLREGRQTGVPGETPPTACPLIGFTY